ncbi:MAG TPA: D-alanyl-D-alanine carboxypeptidase [Saprospiraceae bacterium]|nr:D-alanyl-D-alanine carboxypeptidase [Saprospiraceae bacterium]
MLSCKVTHLTEKKVTRQLDPLVKASPVFNAGFTGFYLADALTGEALYNHFADKYFTPASNTKILTLYTAFTLMGKSIPILAFASDGDTMWIRGAGGPTLFHPEFEDESPVIAWIQSATSGKTVFVDRNHMVDKRYGPGWSWGDFTYYYQTERSDLPLFGNAVRFQMNPGDSFPEVHPSIFTMSTSVSADTGQWVTFYVEREETTNTFKAKFHPHLQDTIKRAVPIRWDSTTFSALFEWKTGIPLKTASPVPQSMEWQSIFALTPDSIYRKFMHESDNFLAEQLLLASSFTLFDTLSSNKVIQYMKDSVLQNTPDPVYWFDGSGLSRYNKLTPRTVAHILKKLYDDFGGSSVYYYFPAGGVSGTIKNLYAGDDGPYVFAKTGTLSGVHCLSGYLLTDQGRTFIFSFMHNNFPGSALPTRREMEKVLRFIKHHY